MSFDLGTVAILLGVSLLSICYGVLLGPNLRGVRRKKRNTRLTCDDTHRNEGE